MQADTPSGRPSRRLPLRRCAGCGQTIKARKWCAPCSHEATVAAEARRTQRRREARRAADTVKDTLGEGRRS